MRSFQLLRALAQWAPTDLVTYSESDTAEAVPPLAKLCLEVKVIRLPVHPRTATAFFRRNLVRALRGVNPLVDRFHAPELRCELQMWLSSRRYAVLIMEHTWIAPYIQFLRAMQPRALMVLDAHNIESDLWRQYYRSPKHWWYRPAAFRYFRAMLEIESKFIPAFDLILATSALDCQRLQTFSRTENLAMIPNGTAVNPPLGRPTRTGPPTVGFLGSLDYPPNEAAVIDLLNHIWPRIIEQFPAAQLLIAGECSSATVRKIARSMSSVRLLGPLAEVESFLDRLDVMIVPLRHGSGTRIKILDAWARGLPVVSTTKGAEGLEHTEGEDIFIADTPPELAGAVVRLLSDPTLRQRLGSRTVERIKSLYSWTAIGKRLTDLLEARLLHAN